MYANAWTYKTLTITCQRYKLHTYYKKNQESQAYMKKTWQDSKSNNKNKITIIGILILYHRLEWKNICLILTQSFFKTYSYKNNTTVSKYIGKNNQIIKIYNNNNNLKYVFALSGRATCKCCLSIQKLQTKNYFVSKNFSPSIFIVELPKLHNTQGRTLICSFYFLDNINTIKVISYYLLV